MGQEYDVEGHAPNCCPESEGVPQGGDTEQAGDAGGGSPAGAPPRVALLGYSDPPGFNILTQDILLEKSPKMSWPLYHHLRKTPQFRAGIYEGHSAHRNGGNCADSFVMVLPR